MTLPTERMTPVTTAAVDGGLLSADVNNDAHAGLTRGPAATGHRTGRVWTQLERVHAALDCGPPPCTKTESCVALIVTEVVGLEIYEYVLYFTCVEASLGVEHAGKMQVARLMNCRSRSQ